MPTLGDEGDFDLLVDYEKRDLATVWSLRDCFLGVVGILISFLTSCGYMKFPIAPESMKTSPWDEKGELGFSGSS